MKFLPQLMEHYQQALDFEKWWDLKKANHPRYRKLPSEAKQLIEKFPAMANLDRAAFQLLLTYLESEHCKRMLFSARQAQVFDEVGAFSRQHEKSKIHPPFGFFYMEFDEPIMLHLQEPGYSDACHAFLYSNDVLEVTEWLNPNVKRKIRVTKLTFFFKSNQGHFVDRTWSVSPEGYPIVGRQLGLPGYEHMTMTRSELGSDGKEGEGSFIHEANIPDWLPLGEFISVHLIEKKDWWEQAILAMTDLVYWIFAFTMAKSVKIAEVPTVTRQVRRSLERKGEKVPQPWHVVRVEPKTVVGKQETVGEGGTHSYRYDVIGHLRFNKHKTKTGVYIDTVEWVSDHQRGLENELYIPKTYKVDDKKTVDDNLMKQYINTQVPPKEK